MEVEVKKVEEIGGGGEVVEVEALEVMVEK
jgi:hypothetical protein